MEVSMNMIERLFIEPFDKLCEQILQFMPHILAFLLLFAVGLALGWLLKILSERMLRTFRFDRLVESLELKETLHRWSIKIPLSRLLARIIGWIVIFIFTIISLRALQIPAVEGLLQRFFLYLPNVIIAAVILFLGYILSNFLGRAALIASVNAGIKLADLIGKLVRLAVFLIAATMSLEQLGIGSITVIIAFGIVFGGIVFALALAFGIGGRHMAREYLEKKFMKPEEKDDIEYL
jgi:hypothetical protein